MTPAYTWTFIIILACAEGGQQYWGCYDKDQECKKLAAWGECSVDSVYMNENCRKACGRCSTRRCDTGEQWKERHYCDFMCPGFEDKCKYRDGMIRTIPKCGCLPGYVRQGNRAYCIHRSRCQKHNPTPQPSGCGDVDPRCPTWVRQEGCNQNRYFMERNCKLSCHFCTSRRRENKCIDKEQWCPTWTRQGQCQSNYEWMLRNCKRSCNFCKKCSDTDQRCSSWSGKNWCYNHSDWMKSRCKRTCGLCDKPTGPTKTCTDRSNSCQSWKWKGFCSSRNWSYQQYVRYNCRFTCGLCNNQIAALPPGAIRPP